MAIMIFNEGHIWCVKKYNHSWFNLDSLSDAPKLVQFRKAFRHQASGWIIIWDNAKPSSNKPSVDSSSKVKQQSIEAAINQESDDLRVDPPRISTSKRSSKQASKHSSKQSSMQLSKRFSKRHRTDTSLIFDEFLLNCEREEPSETNRFELLTIIEQ